MGKGLKISKIESVCFNFVYLLIYQRKTTPKLSFFCPFL